MVRLSDVDSLPTTLAAPEVAELLGVGVDHLYRLVRDGRCPIAPVRLGRRLRWPTATVLRELGIEQLPGGGR